MEAPRARLFRRTCTSSSVNRQSARMTSGGPDTRTPVEAALRAMTAPEDHGPATSTPATRARAAPERRSAAAVAGCAPGQSVESEDAFDGAAADAGSRTIAIDTRAASGAVTATPSPQA